MHQDIEDSLAASSISHAGGPQSPARSAENLLNGHRSKGLMELGRREEMVTDCSGSAQVHTSSMSLLLFSCLNINTFLLQTAKASLFKFLDKNYILQGDTDRDDGIMIMLTSSNPYLY